MAHVEQLATISSADHAALVALLRDSIENGASVGWVLPIGDGDIERFWDNVARDLGAGDRAVLVVREAGTIIASVQLEFAGKPNGRHRAEVQKMLVHSTHRRKGLGRELMLRAEALARERGRSLLVLDTESSSAGQRLYASVGFSVAGEIPNFAIGTMGGWTPTTYMYKLL